MTIYLNFYSTSHCHLCEQAEALLTSLSKRHDIQWTWFEIMEDTALLENYGTKIPVIRRLDNNTEISYPFTEQEIEMLLYS